MTVNEIKERIGSARTMRQHYDAVRTAGSARLAELEREALDLLKAQTVIQIVAKETQDNFVYRISDIVSMALEAVFGEDAYQFLIEFEQKRGKTEAEISFVRGGEKVDPLSASGGGAVDVASFALRIAIWSLLKTSSKKNSDTIILDEPFRFLSRDLQPRAGEMLSMLSKKMGIQFIMVTHNPDLIESSDNVYTVVLENGVSNVREGA